MSLIYLINYIYVIIVFFVFLFQVFGYTGHQCLMENQKVEMTLTARQVFWGGKSLTNIVHRILIKMFAVFVQYFKNEMDLIDAEIPNANKKWRDIVEEILEEFEVRERKTYLELMKVARRKMGRGFLNDDEVMDAIRRAFWEKRFNMNLNKFKKIYHDALLEALDLCHQSVLDFRGLIRAYKMKLLGVHSDNVKFNVALVPKAQKDNLNDDEKELLTRAGDELIKTCLLKYFLHEMESRFESKDPVSYREVRRNLPPDFVQKAKLWNEENNTAHILIGGIRVPSLTRKRSSEALTATLPGDEESINNGNGYTNTAQRLIGGIHFPSLTRKSSGEKLTATLP